MGKILNNGTMLVQCEECKQSFTLSATNGTMTFYKLYVVKESGEEIQLSYYDCPHCGKRHFVQIDDEQTKRALEESKRMFVKLAAKRHNYEQIPKKQSDKYKKAQKHLSSLRMALMTKYQGAVIVDESGSETTLRFSV